MRLFLSLIIVAIAALMVIKSNWLVQNFGHSAWAEAKLGSWGGTRTLIKFIGIVGIILALLYGTGLLKNVVLLFIPEHMISTPTF